MMGSVASTVGALVTTVSGTILSVGGVASEVLPVVTSVKEYYYQERSFAWLNLPACVGFKNICTFVPSSPVDSGDPTTVEECILVVSSNGFIYKCSFDKSVGGAAKVISTHAITPP